MTRGSKRALPGRVWGEIPVIRLVLGFAVVPRFHLLLYGLIIPSTLAFSFLSQGSRSDFTLPTMRFIIFSLIVTIPRPPFIPLSPLRAINSRAKPWGTEE